MRQRQEGRLTKPYWACRMRARKPRRGGKQEVLLLVGIDRTMWYSATWWRIRRETIGVEERGKHMYNRNIKQNIDEHHFSQAYPTTSKLRLRGIPNRETWAQRWPQWRLRRWATNAIAAAAVIVINVGSRSWRWRRPARKWVGCPGRSPEVRCQYP